MSKITKAKVKYKFRPLFEGIPSFQGYLMILINSCRKRGWHLEYDLMVAKPLPNKQVRLVYYGKMIESLNDFRKRFQSWAQKNTTPSAPSAANNTWPLRV